MSKVYLTKISLGSLLCLLTLSVGCCINVGGCYKTKYEKTVHLSVPLPSGSSFTAQTHNGSITINGSDVADCNLTATIIAKAATEEKARELAEEIKIKLEPFGNKLTAKIIQPKCRINRSFSVNLDINIPNQTNMEIITHNGNIRITNIIGQLNGGTHNGNVITEQISGTVRLETHNGSIICKDISGDMKLRTHNGRINAAYSRNAPSVFDSSIVSYNGGINFTAPPNLSATVNVSTHNGSINTDLPINIIGKISKNQLTGTIGKGLGKLHLETHDGSIKIR